MSKVKLTLMIQLFIGWRCTYKLHKTAFKNEKTADDKKRQKRKERKESENRKKN